MYNLTLNDFPGAVLDINDNNNNSSNSSLIKDDDKYLIGGFGGNVEKVNSKILDYKIEKDELIIFEQTGYEEIDEDGISICDVDSCKSFLIDHMNSENQNLEEEANTYALSKNFNTYKHIFKQNNENGYYWYSSEFVK